ncbi:hypothetical protein EV401DRAFT_1983645 [Pisolithus croceorrhizus]|nr:hypothetical protein EV401DRAFT_1983645 [Pisolithus croceorrhizus]
MSGTVLKNFVMFRRLCGDRAAERVRLVTTMWDKVEDARLAENGVAQLETSFWKLLKALARHKRRLNSSKCAWDIIMDLTGKGEAQSNTVHPVPEASARTRGNNQTTPGRGQGTERSGVGEKA